MRYRSICAAMLGIITMAGSNLPADPTTQPVAPPAVQPAAPVCDVYLTPFTALGNDNSLDWVGKAVQQNLLTDIARAKLHPLGSDKPIANASDAQTAAKAAGAKYLISGSYQIADQQVRFNGQVIDAATGNVLGGISTTGAVRDLFTMEDALSSQAVQQLGQLAIANANKPAVAPAAAPGGQPPVPPIVVQIVQPPAAAPVVASKYQGSALEQYVNSNHNPSADYSQPPLDASGGDNFASTPGSNYNADTGIFSGYGFGYGFGLFYPLPPYGKYGYGTDGHTRWRDRDHGDTPTH